MLGLGETLARRRGLLRAMKSLRGLEDHYRRIVFSGAGARVRSVGRSVSRSCTGATVVLAARLLRVCVHASLLMLQENCRHDRVLALLRPYCPALLPEGRAAGRSKADC